MKTILSFVAALLFCGAMHGQACEGTILDGAGVIKDPSTITAAAQLLTDQGADVHVITVPDIHAYGNTLNDVQAAYERACPSWLNGGTRKSNLFVLYVAPTQGKKLAIFGSTYRQAFSTNDAERIYSQAANTAFRTGQWENGLAAALTGLNAAIKTYYARRESTPTSTPTTQSAPVSSTLEQPTSLAPLWWILGLAGFGGLSLFGYTMWRNRKKDAEEAQAAQQRAITAQSRAATLLTKADTDAKDRNTYAAVAAEYTRLSNSLSSDPTESGLSTAMYQNLEGQWNAVAQKLAALISGSKSEAKRMYAQAEPKVTQMPRPVYQEPTVNETPTHTHTHTERVIERETYTPVPIMPVVIEEERPSWRREPEPEPEPSRSSWTSSRDDSESSFSSSSSDDSQSSFDSSSSSNDDNQSSF
jgi:uncharacterized membrane protein YgcG